MQEPPILCIVLHHLRSIYRSSYLALSFSLPPLVLGIAHDVGVCAHFYLQVLGIYPYLETLVPQLILSVILLITFMIAHYRGKMDALRKELTVKA